MTQWILKTARTMAHLHTGNGVHSLEYKSPEQRKEAALMSAAPEMLEALELVVRIIVESPGADRSQLHYLQKIVAKARGEL